jgi:hypothetical protein
MADMPDDRPPALPLQSSAEAAPGNPAIPSTSGSDHYTLRQAALEAGCSESTLRRLVKSRDVPYLQEETKTGFRYLFEPSTIPVIAHKASMRRPSGRPPGRRVGGDGRQASTYEGLQEASTSVEEVSALRVERDLLRAENSRLWSQIERLTESVTRLALPAARTPGEVASEEAAEGRSSVRRSIWDWFFGRNPGR